MTSTASGDIARLTALIARQRRELDRMRAQATTRAVVDMAQGILMERLGCSPAEAGQQLARLAHSSGSTLADLAADLTGQKLAETQAADGRQQRETGEPGQRGGPDWRTLSLAAAAMREPADGDRVAAAALEEALAPTGGAAVALWLLGPDGCLDLVGEAGLGPRESGRWRHLAPDLDCLPQRAVGAGPVMCGPAGGPAGDPVPLVAGWLPGARAVLPMRDAGLVVGVFTAIWPSALPEFGPPLRRQLTALADLCAQAVAGSQAGEGGSSWLYGLLDGLVESVLVARPVRDPGGTVRDFLIGHVSDGFRDPAGRRAGDVAHRPLLELYPLAALPGGLFDRAVEVLATGAPHHMPRTTLVSEPGALMDIHIAALFDGVAIAWRHVDEAERFASLLQHAERLGRIGGWEENLLTGEVQWTESAAALFGRELGTAVPLAGLNAHVVPDDAPALEQFRDAVLREKRSTAAAFRIIRADDDSVRQMRVFAEPVTDGGGRLVAVRGAYQDVSAHYHTQLALTATRDRLADTEERAEEEHRLAVRLQQAITPWSSEPVAAAGLDIAARYRPAGPARFVSGDWYDTVLLPTRQVLLAVGDIAGHGIDAVTGMVELRNCLRGFAITGAAPADLLSWLNKVACHLTDGTIGTAICGLYDPASMNLRWARAGHHPPVLVRDGVAEHLPLPPGLMLGADPDAGYEEVTTHLDPGDVLLLFTDGLVERRDVGIDDALARLLRVASRPMDRVSDFADYLLTHAASNTGDDACLVAVRVRG
jgi:PAS domain-containing protein